VSCASFLRNHRVGDKGLAFWRARFLAACGGDSGGMITTVPGAPTIGAASAGDTDDSISTMFLPPPRFLRFSYEYPRNSHGNLMAIDGLGLLSFT
jgi:hypothetical protein